LSNKHETTARANSAFEDKHKNNFDSNKNSKIIVATMAVKAYKKTKVALNIA